MKEEDYPELGNYEQYVVKLVDNDYNEGVSRNEYLMNTGEVVIGFGIRDGWPPFAGALLKHRTNFAVWTCLWISSGWRQSHVQFTDDSIRVCDQAVRSSAWR